MAHPERAVLMVVTAPAGAGKTTLCDRLLAEFPRLRYSISCTTRQPRGNEQNGVDYHFLSQEDFKKRIDAGDFLEYANVHGNWYGTLASTVQDALMAGDDIIMDIDVQGAQSLRSSIDEGDPFLRDAFFDVFVLPPSLAELERRLNGRGEDSPEVIVVRMNNAIGEMDCQNQFRHKIVNDDLERAYATIKEIYLSEVAKGVS